MAHLAPKALKQGRKHQKYDDQPCADAPSASVEWRENDR